jgi:hypothetical protein
MYLDPSKTIENCPHRKYDILLRNGMKAILKVLTRRYINATYIFMFETNPFTVIIIWFVKGS